VRARIEERLNALLTERDAVEQQLAAAAGRGEEATAQLYRLRSALERAAMRCESVAALAERLRDELPDGRFQKVPNGLRNVIGTVPGRHPKRVVVVGARTVFAFLGIVLVVVVATALAYLAWGAISLVLIAVLFALALNPAVEFFVRRGWRRGLAATAVFLISFLTAAAII
jgi:hypothetical protein